MINSITEELSGGIIAAARAYTCPLWLGDAYSLEGPTGRATNLF